MRTKISLGFVLIVVLLLLTSVISIFEYTRMSDYVSNLIGANIHSINVSQKLALACDEYNLRMLTEIGEADKRTDLSFDQKATIENCNAIRDGFLAERDALPYADSVNFSYSAYMLVSMELKEVIESDFIDSREWYFDRLQPRYNKLRSDIEHLNAIVYSDLQTNSSDFEEGFYRSIIPGVVSVAACILVVFLLLFYILAYYVRPTYRMLNALEAFNAETLKNYNVHFDGDDQLSRLNEGIRDLADENNSLKMRIRKMKSE